MNKAEYLKILESGVTKWNDWREEKIEIRPYLSGTDLSNIDLSGINLSRTYLSEATFFGTNLTNADLSDTQLSNVDLSEANLSGANLCNADLSGSTLLDANLTNADLSGANLAEANLTGADLSNATLPGSDLSYTNLTDANLSDADLSDAYLYGSNLIYSNLQNTDLSKCRLSETIFGHTELTNCIGLEEVEVSGPCVIDFSTIRASKNLPKSFLLKLGLPELYIDYLPDFYFDEGIRLYPVFLSHSWENKDFARKLYEALIAKGVHVFFDDKRMKPGDDIFKSISRGIDHYDKMILVCSEASLKSWWVDREIERVLKKERNLYKEGGEQTDLLIPITIDDVVYKWNGPKAEEIQRYVIGDFRIWQDDTAFEKALNDLIHALNVDRPDIKPTSFL